MVKAGVFLLARLWPVLAGTDLWFGIVVPLGWRRCCSAQASRCSAMT
jgi:NADH:ubiquinone oxidoreductase subunit 5 (subunit L)/multisubunit Na+/H+ antiporter MnhA subunit